MAAKIIFYFLLLFLSWLQAQTPAEIRGIILNDLNNQPIVSVNVQIMGTELGTVTNEKGEFTLNWTGVFPIRVLATHIAFESIEIEITGPQNISIRLKSTVLKGEEVTITGEHSAADKDITSSVEIISLRQIEKRGIRDISEILREMESVNILTTTSGRQTASIRGSNANEISIYLDGVKLNRALDGEANLAFVDLGDLGQVEVIRGSNSTLFGSGNFGGVILMRSLRPENNYFNFSRSLGLTHSSDQDLSGTISLKGGPLSMGARFSGKSRLYDGRTMYTSIFENYSSSLDIGKMTATVRRVLQDNTIKFHSGGIITADKMIQKQFNLTGDLLFTSGWDFQWGRGNWVWDDNFFSTVSRNLIDNTSILRLSKTFEFKNINGTLQVEEESQEFFGNQKFKDSYSEKNWNDDLRLKQVDKGWAGVIRYQQKSPVENIDNFRVEFGLRNSKAEYSHDQEINYFDSTALTRHIEYKFDDSSPLQTTRLGMFMTGKMINGNQFEIFFNQGTNHRLPTLNDRVLWGVGLVNLEDYYLQQQRAVPRDPTELERHDIKLQELKIIIASMKSGLKREYVSTTELSTKIKFDQLFTKPFTSFELGINIFRNSYLDKIAYRRIPNSLVAPFNTTTAWLNGLELSGKTFTWDNRIQFAVNMLWVNPSDELIFPDTPSSSSTLVADFQLGIIHLNMSYLTQGPHKYIRGGTLQDQNKSISNTNLTISAAKQFGLFDISVNYAVRNLFSETTVVVNANNINSDGSFNYFDANRHLFSVKISLQTRSQKK